MLHLIQIGDARSAPQRENQAVRMNGVIIIMLLRPAYFWLEYKQAQE